MPNEAIGRGEKGKEKGKTKTREVFGSSFDVYKWGLFLNEDFSCK